MREIFDAAVVGAGPAGLAAILGLARRGVRAALIGAAEPAADTRTTALLAASVATLDELGAWPACTPHAAPLVALRIVDASSRLIRAPTVTFRASEAGAAAFGHNIPNPALTGALADATRSDCIARFPAPVAALQPAAGHVQLTLSDGQALGARVVIGADGRNSAVRQQAGIAARHWAYGQTAIATRFAVGRPHDGLCTELHTAAGPLTVVPLPGDAMSLVWVERPAEAAALLALGDAAFLRRLTERLRGMLGALGALGPRRAFPLAGLVAQRLNAPRVLLVGEAAHVIPPTGAQGLNLGIRDAATAAQLVGDAVMQRSDPGAADVTEAYASARRADIWARVAAADALNRSLTSRLLPVAVARSAGLALLATRSPLRDSAMRRGMGL